MASQVRPGGGGLSFDGAGRSRSTHRGLDGVGVLRAPHSHRLRDAQDSNHSPPRARTTERSRSTAAAAAGGGTWPTRPAPRTPSSAPAFPLQSAKPSEGPCASKAWPESPLPLAAR